MRRNFLSSIGRYRLLPTYPLVLALYHDDIKKNPFEVPLLSKGKSLLEGGGGEDSREAMHFSFMPTFTLAGTGFKIKR